MLRCKNVLRNIVICPCFQANHGFFGPGLIGEHDNGNILGFFGAFEASADLITVHRWQLNIKHDKLRWVFQCLTNGIWTIIDDAHNQAHDIPNLFITDGSCMTSSSCVNPSLTYMALSARAAHYAADRLATGEL